MNLEQQLLDLLLSSPNKKTIKIWLKNLRRNQDLLLAVILRSYKEFGNLDGVVQKSPFLNYSPLVDNLQILDPLNLDGLNLLKPRGINSIIGMGIVAN